MARIYSKTGDDGTTGSAGGQRVSKDSDLIEAYGSLDELNAILGLIRTHAIPDDMDCVLEKIQNELFALGAEISMPDGAGIGTPEVGDEEIAELEHAIDALQDRLPPLRQFILPGGSREAAELHLARTVARRAERRCVTLSRRLKINPGILRYLNRLSDLLFLQARYANQFRNVPEIPAQPKA